MTTILIVGIIVLGILHYLYPEHRKKVRIPIVILIGIVLLTFASPSFKCAINLPPRSIATLDWDNISYGHRICMLNHRLSGIRD
ncbi:hypothetical protein [Croceicoccus sp. Ery15]|uniref:hypothetical protein n=1 Tax=Croceicoccus sp. Ery15 TaxID=1703338 RepID=UPI001E3570D3|nr:hypothetical protein [Croceicoccus sp. Ery15]